MITKKTSFSRITNAGRPVWFAVLIWICVLPVGANAQTDAFATGLMKSFSRYSAQHLPEKCFVHTDRNDYLAGDVLWFKVYAVDGYYNKPLSLSKVVYAELLDAENNPVLQGKVALVNGDAAGSFDLPDTLSGGTYRFRAYTNWMKNAGADYFFEKELRIYNARESNVKTRALTGNRFGSNDSGSAVDSSGYTMHLQKKAAGESEVVVTWPHGLTGNDSIWLFAQTHGLPAFCLGVKTITGEAHFSFNERLLGQGIVQLTVFDAKKSPVCERLMFVPPKNLKITLTERSSAVHTRDEVAFTLATTDEKDDPLVTDLSVSVFRTDSLTLPEEVSMPDYYWLRSELPIAPAIAGEKADDVNTTGFPLAETLLSHRKWTRFTWPEMLDSTARPAFYAPETRDPVITGRVISAANGRPAPRIYAYAGVAGKQTLFRAAESDERGMVRFEMTGFSGNDQLIVQTGREDSAYRVELVSPFFDGYSTSRNSAGATGRASTVSLAERLFDAQIRSVYQTDSGLQWKTPSVPATFFYGKPDFRYHLDDYKRFTTMEEVMREYVKACNVFRSEGNVKLVLLNLPAQQFFTDPPLVLVDGIPVFDEDRPMNLDPLKISDIELVNREYLLGPQKFSGIINCLSYPGDLGGFILPAQASAIDYEGLQLERQIYSPGYNTVATRNSRVPDYRTQLYWNPSVKTGADGQTQIKFYASDIPGRYTMVVHGISAEGISGSKTIGFTVTARGAQSK